MTDDYEFIFQKNTGKCILKDEIHKYGIFWYFWCCTRPVKFLTEALDGEGAFSPPPRKMQFLAAALQPKAALKTAFCHFYFVSSTSTACSLSQFLSLLAILRVSEHSLKAL